MSEPSRTLAANADVGYRLQQIDVLKGLAVLAVVATHSLSASQLVNSWAVLHIWQAVPLFVVMLGVTAAMSFERRHRAGAAHFFTRGYLTSRALRLLLPFALVWVLSVIVAYDKRDFRFDALSFLLRMPYPGRGNYFVPVVVVLLLIAPAVYVAYRKAPWVTLAGLIGLNLVFELAAAHVALFDRRAFVYSAAFPRYLAAFALGFFIVDVRVNKGVRWAVLGVGAALSVFYLYVGNSGLWAPPFLPDWRTQNVLAVFYPALLAAIGIRYLPQRSDNPLLVGTAWIGRASYHVFLMQMLFFTLVPGSRTWLMLIVNVVICAFAGLGFYFAELWVRDSWRAKTADSADTRDTAEH